MTAPREPLTVDFDLGYCRYMKRPSGWRRIAIDNGGNPVGPEREGDYDLIEALLLCCAQLAAASADTRRREREAFESGASFGFQIAPEQITDGDWAAVEAERRYPTATVTKDGDQWCVLSGPNLQEGVAGFGDTPALAWAAFLAALDATKAPGEKQRLAFEWMIDRLEELQPTVTIDDAVMARVFPEFW